VSAPISGTVGLSGGPWMVEVRGLTVAFPAQGGAIRPVRGVTFGVAGARTLGIVGESGSGKSMTLRAVLGMVPRPGLIESGSVLLGGQELVGAPPALLQSIRGSQIGMIFQDPMASLNPVLSVGDQLSEVIRVKLGLGHRAAADRAAELFDRVGIKPARDRLRAYPHEFSGGMAQRVMIAIAIALKPKVLLADEPTTALDVSVQDQVLELLEFLRDEDGMSMIIVSHDIGVIARMCDDVAVMYGGQILELGSVDEVLRQPRHPYTRMLLATVPSLDARSGRRLASIPGQLPDLATVAAGCPYVGRCPSARDACSSLVVALDAPMGRHASACPFV